MEDKLTIKESYLAMIMFLENLYELTKSDDIGSILGSMQLMADGGTMDPAYWNDWIKAVNKIKKSS